MVCVVDNASTPPAAAPADLDNVAVVADPTQPPNLADMWNRALDAIRDCRPADVDRWDVALLCDDTAVPAGWMAAVCEQMRGHGAMAASTHPYEPLDIPVVKTVPDGDFHNRLCGWAFVLRGEAGLRADTNMRWWWCDIDLDWQARAAGGIVLAAGPVAANQRPNEWTTARDDLGTQTGVDRAAFVAKHGWAPW
jgi:hypothetical protein